VRDGDDFVARSDVESLKSKDQRVGAAADTDGMAGAAIVGKSTLEGLHLFTEDIESTLKDAADCSLNLVPVCKILRSGRSPGNHEKTFTSGT